MNPEHRLRFQLARIAIPFALAVSLGVAAEGDDKPGADDNEAPLVIHGPPPPEPPAVLSRDEMGRVTLRATRLREPLVLDGRLEERVYREVPPMTGFVQQEPNEGAPATEDTEAWVFFDDRNVYITARCWDDHPERMVITEMRRDHFNIFQNEALTVVLDTFYNRRDGFFFQTNPLGALRDQEVGNEGESNNRDWNTVWDSKARVFDQGWIVEMAIPFKSLRYREGRDQIWSINLRRSIRWKNEEVFLSPVAASHRFRGIYKFSEAATLVGVQAPVSSRNLELKPYGISSVVTNNDEEPPISNDLDGDVGFDVKYGLTKSLTADFSYNTDFAQVEEDEAQVNLTRFSLFFPEKRDFFLEGQSIFGFGGVQMRGGFFNRPGGQDQDLTPNLFFSRRIGLTPEGEDPLLAGGRVTGRAGSYRLGLLNIQTEGIDGTGVEGTNFSVVRLRRDVLDRSDVGLLVTHRDTSLTEGAGSNSVFGFDANFTFFRNLRVNGYYARSRTPLEAGGSSLDGDPSSYLGKMDYGGDRYGLQLEHLFVGGAFNPEIGFLRREAFRRSFARARFSPRSRFESVRRFVMQGELDYVTDPDGRVETRRYQGELGIELESSDQATVRYNRSFEFLPEEFEIADGVILPVADYEFQDVELQYQFGAQRPVPGFITFRTGSFFGGDRREITYSGRVDVSTKFSVEPRFSLNFVELPEGDFTARLVSTRVNYTLSPRMAVSSFLQYSSSSDSLSSSVRLRWEYEPGSDFFVVYTDGRSTDVRGFPTLQTSTFAVKLTKLFRF